MKPKFLRIAQVALSVAILSIYSCSKDKLQQNSSQPTTVDKIVVHDENYVTLKQASLAASQTNKSLMVQKIRPKISVNNVISLPGNKVIDNVIPVPDELNTSYYIFNYKDGGYAIIAGDRRVDPVMAYSETGRYEKTDKIPLGLLEWLAVNNNNVQKLRENHTLKVPSIVAHNWNDLLTVADSTLISTNKLAPPEPPCQDQNFLTIVGPLVATQWGQGSGFNDFCPAGTYSGGHVPAGCVATAMAQIMYYWQFPSWYNWSSMPLNSGNSDVAHLISDAGVSVGMSYADSGSGAQTSNIPGSLIYNFGYQSASFGNYDFNTVANNLNYGRPVILSGFTDHYTTGWLWWQTDHPSGEGHAWVCDGYQTDTWSSCDCGCGGYYALLHMNWGWNEWWVSSNYNGWYSEGNWIVTRTDATFNFQYFKQMVYDIHP